MCHRLHSPLPLIHSYLLEQDFVCAQVNLVCLFLITNIQLWNSVGHSASHRKARDVVFYFWYLVTIAGIGPLLSMSVRTTSESRLEGIMLTSLQIFRSVLYTTYKRYTSRYAPVAYSDYLTPAILFQVGQSWQRLQNWIDNHEAIVRNLSSAS